jgi:hypothetical protein
MLADTKNALLAWLDRPTAETALPDAVIARKVEQVFAQAKCGDYSQAGSLHAEGEAVLPHLVKYITDPNPEVKHAVIALAGHVRSLRGVGILTALVRDRDAGVALAAVRALYQYQDGASIREFGRIKLRDNLLEYAKAHPYQAEPLLLLRHFGAQEPVAKALADLRQKPDGLLVPRPGDPRPAAWLGDTAYPGVTPTLLVDCALAEAGDAEAEARVLACVKLGRDEDVLLLTDVLPVLTRPAILRALADLLTDGPRGRRLVPGRGLGMRLCDLLLEALVSRTGVGPAFDMRAAQARPRPAPRYTDAELADVCARIDRILAEPVSRQPRV